MKKVSALFALLAGLAMGNVSAEPVSGYVTDARGVAARSGTGLCWRTGYWTPSMATAECDPDLVAKTQAPSAKGAAPAIPAAGNDALTLSADGLFAFGKSTLLPKGKSKLDEFVTKIGNRKFDQMLVTGHTDRLGSAQANKALSEKRAEAVKAYLVAKKLDGKRIVTEGKGSAMPVTKANQCPGKGGAKVIDCLQPDRRVEIKLSGLK